MKIEFHTKKSENTCHFDNAHKESFATRIERALKHLADRILEVQVHLEDESPTKNKFDGHCKIQVVLLKGKPVVINAHGESFTDLIADSVARIQHAVEHIFDKKKHKRKHPRTMVV